MREFRKKQKRLKKIFTFFVVFTVIYLLVYIGVEPSLPELIGRMGTMLVAYSCDILVVVTMALLFSYFSKYGKSDSFLSSVEDELSDAGYYFTSREENTIEAYYDTVIADLRSNGYKIDEKVVVDDFEFSARAIKGREYIYILKESEVDRNDIIAYQESAIYDVTAVNLKRKGNAVMLYICDKAEDSAIELSKVITPIGKKEKLKFANAIIELSTRRCYFLGNKKTKCQQMIANYAMNCDLPIKEQYIGTERLAFQDKLEEHMKDFNIKDFKNGTFFAHY